MPPKRKNKEPSIFAHSLHSFLQEIVGWRNLALTEWPLLLLMIGGITLLLFISGPLPPRNVYLAVGQPGSSFEQLGKKFQTHFASEGVTLHLVYNDGYAGSMREVSNPNSKVSAALSLAGITSKDHYPHLQTLGSIEYVPIWLFHRGGELNTSTVMAAFTHKKVSIGPVGSGTAILTDRLLRLTDVHIKSEPNFLHMSDPQATQMLIDDEIFGMFIADAENGPNLTKLLKDENIRPYNFEYAQAISKKLPILIPVVLPKGALDLKLLRPAHDVNMLATTAIMLIKKDMHPAIQHMYMVAAELISRDLEPLFSNPDFFPAYLDRNFPLSPIANRYYEHGAPLLKDKLPLWLVSYLDKIWLILVGIFAVVFPLFRLFPNYRHTRAILLISNAYVEFLEIEREIGNTDNPQTLQEMLDRLDELNTEMLSITIPIDEMNRLYSMKSALTTVRNLVINKLNRSQKHVN